MIQKAVHSYTLWYTFGTGLYQGTSNGCLVEKGSRYSGFSAMTIYMHTYNEEMESAMRELHHAGCYAIRQPEA